MESNILICLPEKQISRRNRNKTLLNKLIIIGTDCLDFCEGQHNWLLLMLCWIVRLYHRIGKIEETERNEGRFGDTFW